MRRRPLLGVLGGVGVALAGCSGPGAEVTRPATGEVDVSFRTLADQDVELSLELVDGRGRTVDSMTSVFPPDQPEAPSFYAGGLAYGPYILTIQTEAAEAVVEWTVVECPRLELLVTVTEPAGLRVERTCEAPTAERPVMVR